MEKFFRFNDTTDANELILPLSSIRGFDVTGATTMVLYFDGINNYDGGGELTITVDSATSKDILKSFANAASSGGEAMMDFIDENTGSKIHPSVVSFVQTNL